VQPSPPRPIGLAPASPPAARRELIAVFALAVCLRVVLLSGPAVQFHADEATNGVMALDVLRGGRIPYFAYGDGYGGGQGVEVLLLAPLFSMFGATERVAKIVPVAESLLVLFLVWSLLGRWVSRRASLLGLLLLATSSPFTICSFKINGTVTTMAAGWAGLLMTLEACRGARLSPRPLFLAGLLLGFAFYLFPSALYYLALALFLLALLRHRRLPGELPALAAGLGGYLVGVLPLLLARAAQGGGLTAFGRNLPALEWDGYARRLAGFFLRDLPSVHIVDLWEFFPAIPPRSWAAFGGAALLAAVALVRAGRPFRGWRECVGSSRPWQPTEEGWAWVWFGGIVLFALLYAVEPRAGMVPRYALPVVPFFTLLAAWGVLALFRRSRRAGWSALVFLVALQIPLLAEFGRKETTTDWNVTVHGADVHALTRYLEDRGYTAVVAPYPIKWRLMFFSGERIKAAAHLFCMDREFADNAEVAARINSGEAPLVFVVDREFRFADAGLYGCPPGWFDLQGFLAALAGEGITFESDAIGDFVVVHRFSRPLLLPPPAEFDTSGRSRRVIPPDAAPPPRRPGSDR
jgi:hypothetical protein